MQGAIFVNSLIEADPVEGAPVGAPKRLFRVLAVDVGAREVALFDVEEKRASPVWWALSELQSALEARAARVFEEEDRFRADTRPDDEFSGASLRIRDGRWDTLGPLLMDPARSAALLRPESRGPLLLQVQEESGKSIDKIYLWLQQYWRGGQTPNALLPKFGRCGAPGKKKPAGEKKRGRPSKLAVAEGRRTGLNVTEAVRKRIVRGARRFYARKVNGRALTWEEAYQNTLERYFSGGLDLRTGVPVPILKPEGALPSLRQFKYWACKDIDERQKGRVVLERRAGRSRFALENRSVTDSTAHLSEGPGDLFLIDATAGDLYLLSALDRRYVVGRPVIYLIVDHWSRMIAGYHVGLEGPSWAGAMMALENAFTEKVSHCARYGVEIEASDWPCAVYPRAITADRGEMVGMAADSLVSVFGVRVTNTPPFRADFKSFVEGQFNILNARGIERQPGWVDKLKDRGGPDYRLDATLTLSDFHRVMIHLILHNNGARRLQGDVPSVFPLPEERPPVPQDLWEWGTEHLLGLGRTMSRERVRSGLLPTTDAARFTHQGLSMHGGLLHYDSAAARASGLMTRGMGKRSPAFTVGYDPRDVSTVYLHSGRGKIEACHLTARHAARFAGKTLEEVQDLSDRRALRRQKDRRKNRQNLATLNAHLDAIASGAKAERDEAFGAMAHPITGNIRGKRAEERLARRKAEAFTRREDAPSSSGTEFRAGEREEEEEYLPFPSA